MAVRTRSNFKSTKNSRITTNGTGAITGSSMNDMFEDVADSFLMPEDATWGSITGTLSNQTDLNSALSGKQATLVSGTNIKTINSTSILGSGNIDVMPLSGTATLLGTLDIDADGYAFNLTNAEEISLAATTQISLTSGLNYFSSPLNQFTGGNVGLDNSAYINWGTTYGASGYGIRDNAGTMEFKNSAGSWTGFGSGGGGGTWGSITGTLSAQTDLQTTLDGKWALTGTSTLTGATDIVGSTSNILQHTFNSLGTTQTNGAGLWLRNTTAAAAGAQQISPGLVLEGQGWKTNATAASQSVKTMTYVLPIQQAANPFLRHVIAGSINGGAYYNMAYFESDGAANNTNLNFGLVTISNSGTNASTTITGNRYINFQTGSGPAGANYEYTFTGRTGSLSGAGGGTLSVGLASAYTQSSGSVGYTTALFNPSINVTSTYTGLVKGLSVQPSVTALASGATLIGYDYGVTGSPSGTNLSFRSTSGDVLLNGSSYINFGTTSGTSGYGVRDNSGVVEVKDSGGSWNRISTLRKATVTVSGGATLRGIGTTPVTLIAAPGSGFYLNIVSVALSYNFSTTQYDFGAGGDPCFEFNTTGGRWGFISQATINSGSDFNFTVHQYDFGAGGTVTPDNAAFILGTLNDGDATTGDGDIDIVIYYTIETTNN